MNDIFYKLLDEATEYSYQEYAKKETGYTREDLFNRKFAELIIQEIDKIVDDLYHALPLEQAAVLLTLDENIKEHFYGVEE